MRGKKRVSIGRGATLYQRGRCWYLDFNSRGIRSKRSLYTSNRDAAEVVARNLIAEADSKAWDILIPRDVLFDDFFFDYKIHSEKHHALSTQQINWPVVARFREFLISSRPHGRALLLSAVRREDVEAFQSVESARGLRNTTVNIYIRALSSFFGLALERGLCRRNPASGTRALPEEPTDNPVLEPDQVRTLLEELGKPVLFLGPNQKGNGRSRERVTPLQDLCTLILNAGLRLGEASHLEWKDIDFRRRLLTVTFKEEYKPKDRDKRSIPMNRVVIEILSRRKLRYGQGRWVFPTRSGGPYHRRNLLRELKSISGRCGLGWVHFYTLRRTFASEAAMAGMPQFQLRQIMGHASIRTTEQHYIHIRASGGGMPPEIAL